MQLAYEHLNLRRNPFGELDTDTRARLALIDIAIPRGEVLQIWGESGRGKTTHLLALHHRMTGSAYECVPEHGDDYATETYPDAGFLLDEAQRVKRRRLAALCELADTLVLGTHEDVSWWCGRPVRTLVLEGIELPRLELMVRKRIEDARRGSGDVPAIPRDVLRSLIGMHGDNIRAIENCLYDAVQRMGDVRDEWRI